MKSMGEQSMSSGPTSSARATSAGKSRTWWHPLFVNVLSHELAGIYDVLGEVQVGIIPLQLDVVLLRRARGRLTPEICRELASLAHLLNRYTFIELKAPSDRLEHGDLDYLCGCVHLYRSQQSHSLAARDITQIVLAPQLTSGLRRDAKANGWKLSPVAPGVHQLTGSLEFTTYAIESDVVSGPGEPILTLFSRVFLKRSRSIIGELVAAGHGSVLQYVIQQVRQFEEAGEEFTLQHREVEIMRRESKTWMDAFLKSIPPEKRLEGLSPEKRLEGLSAETRLEGLSPEKIIDYLNTTLQHLSPKKAARLLKRLESLEKQN
jgi:hypothetical protein